MPIVASMLCGGANAQVSTDPMVQGTADNREDDAAATANDGLGFDLGDILFGGRTRLTPRVSVGSFYTDNVDFESDARSDFVVFVRPGVSLTRTSRRFNTALDFSVSAEYSSDEEGFEFGVVNNSELNSANRFEVVDDILAFQANAAISQQLIDGAVGTSAATASDIDRRQNNFATVQRYLAGPILTYRFGRLVNSESVLRVGYVNIGETTDGEGSDSLDVLVSQVFSSGPLFSTVLWSLTGSYEQADIGDAEEEREQTTFAANGEYVIDRQWSLLGTVGHDDINDPDFRNEDLEGPFWNVGFAARPNRRLTSEVRFGRRFGDDELLFRLDYDISERASLQASFDRTLETEEQLFLRDLSFLGVDDQGNFIDLRTGQLIAPDSEFDPFGLQQGTFIRERFESRLDYARRRDNFAVNGFYESREFVVGTEDAVGGGASWSRRLSRETSSVMSFNVRNTDFEDDTTDQLYTFRAGLNHNFYQDLTLSLNYVHQHRDSDVDDRNATENFVSLTLTKSF